MMNDNDSHGMAASLQGSIQAITETAEVHKRRAILAERQLMESGEQLRAIIPKLDVAIRRLYHLRNLCESLDRQAYESIPIWRVLDILDGAADGE